MLGKDDTKEFDDMGYYLNILQTFYNLDELRTLCLGLKIKYEDLPNGTITGKSLDLIEHCQRHGLTEKLYNQIRHDKAWLFPE